MRIKRVLECEELIFELTEDELYEAFCEQQSKYDEADIRDYMHNLSEEELMQMHGVSCAEFMELVPEIAAEKRRLEDIYDADWQYAREVAVYTITKQYREGKER